MAADERADGEFFGTTVKVARRARPISVKTAKKHIRADATSIQKTRPLLCTEIGEKSCLFPQFDCLWRDRYLVTF